MMNWFDLALRVEPVARNGRVQPECAGAATSGRLPLNLQSVFLQRAFNRILAGAVAPCLLRYVRTQSERQSCAIRKLKNSQKLSKLPAVCRTESDKRAT